MSATNQTPLAGTAPLAPLRDAPQGEPLEARRQRAYLRLRAEARQPAYLRAVLDALLQEGAGR